MNPQCKALFAHVKHDFRHEHEKIRTLAHRHC